ncbi:MAG: NADH:flavin oxidoreductase/NADH oxidase [Ktedonobacterales bacterium]
MTAHPTVPAHLPQHTFPRHTSQPAHLFTPWHLRGVTLRNRIMVSPMCQYSCEARDGVATDWHIVHLGSMAVGGAALVCTEAAAVEARGRISPEDLGIWNEAQIEPLARITAFIAAQGAVPAIQLAHAGRKASVRRPWEGGALVAEEDGGWQVIGPSAIPFSEHYGMPHVLTEQEIAEVVEHFAQAAERAVRAGFQVIEIHGAHGYLLHEFLSPVSNKRIDQYGGSFANRIRLAVEVVRAVRRVWPEHLPLLLRVSATDWLDAVDGVDGSGWDLAQTVELARVLRDEGVDAFDCSSGGNVSQVSIPMGPGYQVEFAAQVRREAEMATIAVGLITSPEQADQIIRMGQADLVALAREELRDPHWPLAAGRVLGQEAPWPSQYVRARR